MAFASQYSKRGTFLSKKVFSVPGIFPQYTGQPMIKRSASLIFSPRTWASSRGRIQVLSGRHFKHAIQGLILSSCIRTTSVSCIGLIAASNSASKVDVIPCFLGLALMIKIFKTYPRFGRFVFNPLNRQAASRIASKPNYHTTLWQTRTEHPMAIDTEETK